MDPETRLPRVLKPHPKSIDVTRTVTTTVVEEHKASPQGVSRAGGAAVKVHAHHKEINYGGEWCSKTAARKTSAAQVNDAHKDQSSDGVGKSLESD